MDLAGFGNTKIRKKIIEWEENYLDHGSIWKHGGKGYYY